MVNMLSIYIRKAALNDVPAITQMIKNSKQYLKQQGINQWQEGYPNQETIKKDVYAADDYVLVCNGQIAGSACLIAGLEPNYLKINGQWVNGTYNRYVTIHRFTISDQFRGQHLARFLMSNLLSVADLRGFKDIRIDTHPQNKIMQHIILTNGFKYRGIIHVNHKIEKNVKRYAYQFTI